jgi:cytochrome c-type protein NapB
MNNKKNIFLMMVLVIAIGACKTKKPIVESDVEMIVQETKVIVNEPLDDVEFISQDDIGYRSEDLFDELNVHIPKVDYTAGAPGTVGNIARSFENSPPLIPHTIVGFVPIKTNSNICLGCHIPAVAAALKATAIPKSHFTDYRPEIIIVDGLYKVNAEEGTMVAKDLGSNLNKARYNCTQCHVPQAKVTVFVENMFDPNFRSEEDAKRSNLIETMGEGLNKR